MPKKHFNSSATNIFNISDIIQSDKSSIHSRNQPMSSVTMKKKSINKNNIDKLRKFKTCLSLFRNTIRNKSCDNLIQSNQIQMTKNIDNHSCKHKENIQDNCFIDNNLFKHESLLKRNKANQMMTSYTYMNSNEKKTLMNQSNIFNLKEKDEENALRYNMLYHNTNIPIDCLKPVIPCNNKIQYRNKQKMQQTNGNIIHNATKPNKGSSVVQYVIKQLNSCNIIDVKEIQRQFRNKGIDIYDFDYHDAFTFGNQECL